MPAFLKLIELENFKSYGGKLVIGPLKSFTAVIGPNGSGKSNFMDAISFVLGERSGSLRVKRLSELIHGSSIQMPVACSVKDVGSWKNATMAIKGLGYWDNSKALPSVTLSIHNFLPSTKNKDSCQSTLEYLENSSVKAVFELTDGTEKSFTRTVEGSSSEYRINGDLVTSPAYAADLQAIGINVKANNFLVFQGDVESIATKKSQDLTSLFEEISGSNAWKADYDRLRAEMLQVEEEIQRSYQKKKGMAAERKEATVEMKEAEKYQRMKEKCAEKLIELQLFRLYHNEKTLEKLAYERTVNEQELEEVETKKACAEETLRDKRKESGKLARELAKMEHDMREAEMAVTKKKPTFIRAKAGIAHVQKKLETAAKSLSRARIAENEHQRDINELQEELAKIETAKAAYEASVARESQSQISDVNLEEKQIREYNRLREEASKQSAAYVQLLDSANRRVKSDQDRLENEVRKKTELEDKLKQKRHKRDATIKRIDNLEEYIITMEDSLANQVKVRDELQNVLGTSKDKIQDLQRDLERITDQLGDATVDKHELARTQRKTEIVEHFKRLYPGVYDRMYNMCEPIHKRYNVAVTKILGIYMEAIVVDTVETANRCIQYLKEQYLEPETFLPLDYIQLRPLKERLRDIKEPANVKLLYDVLNFQPKEIDRAILFATRNVLVCESSEDACRVAYDMDKQKRYDCIALDGTCYQKAGLISGGSLDLARRAKRWDDKQMAQLKSQKEQTTKELREVLARSRKESELNSVQSQIRGLETRLKYNKSDSIETRKEIDQLDIEIGELQEEIEKIAPDIAAIEKTIVEREREIENIKGKVDTAEDEVFAIFCQQIGVPNIRRYEERELQSHQERAKRRMEFENQCNRICIQLEFEKQRDTHSNIARWDRAVLDAEGNLEIAKQAEDNLKMEIREVEDHAKQLESARIAKMKEHDRKEEVVGRWRREVGSVTKQIEDLRKKIYTIDTEIEQKSAERHAVLMHCKMADIAIPVLRGNTGDLVTELATTNDGTGGYAAQEQLERTSRIAINYGLLSNNLKDVEAQDLKITMENLHKTILDLHAKIGEMHAPNMKAMEKLSVARQKFQVTNEAFETSRKKAKKIKTQFEKAKKERYAKFMPCFEHISKQIDFVYKGLTKNQSAQAFLEPTNPEEPYLEGINYNCVAPGKRFQLISNLSGGEKTITALALLFAIHSFHPAPFFVLDEVDASLDNTNIVKVANYIRERAESLQTIVISLKEEFYCHADALIGICSEVGECLRSNVLTVDLTAYDEETENDADSGDKLGIQRSVCAK